MVEIPAEDYSLQPDYWVKRPLDDPEKDWLYPEGNWLEGYAKSIEHPHRRLIIEALKKLTPFESVFEVGANCGPNLTVIGKNFPGTKLAGIDLNADAVTLGKKLVPGADWRVGSMVKLPWANKSFDIGLADAVLLYVSPNDIRKVMGELDRVARRALILVERFDDSVEGVIKSHVWTRNYPVLLKESGYKVEQVKLDEKAWPGSLNWQKFGYLFVGTKER